MRLKRLCSSLLALGITCSMLFQTPVLAAEETATDTAQAAASAVTTNNIPRWPQGPEITSTAAVIMEDSTQTMLYSKNMDQILYPGAAVKVMTTLLALENSQLTDQVTMTATGVSGVTDGGANISAQLDEVFTVEQCLYAIMLSSANDIALQVAEHIGGSVENFVQMMNDRAAQLGCTNTVFTNPTGLPDENQHTTAHDMALIMKSAIDNESFRTIAGTASYTIPATNVSGGDRVLTNNFSMMSASNAAYYQNCLGGREGYTEASGSTLVCAAEKNGITLIAVVLQGASGVTSTEAASLLNYGFDNFQMLSLGDNDFNMVSSGKVYVPAGATADSLTTEDGEVQDDQYTRQYFFGGAAVGTAVMETTHEDSSSFAAESEQNIQAAREYSENRSPIPYALIGGAGFLLMILLIWRIIKVSKS
nr:D-alanyl-D-alanine carboxypeptidase family protein [uncultured Blautia sp.]